MSVTDTKPETAQQATSAGRNDSAVAVQTKPVPRIDNKINTNIPDTTPNPSQQIQGTVSKAAQASSAGTAPKVNQTREQVKKERTTENAEEEQQQQQTLRHAKIRLIPIWLRIVLIFLLLVFALVAGAMVGYGIIGGGNPWEVLKQSTWTHIVDLINKE